MALRSINKDLESLNEMGGVKDCYDLTIQEIQELKKEYNEELFYLISTVFELGYIRGVKAEKNNKHKKTRA